ncbi:hypothetical protein [Symbioplanes lichenis]|uniref:hypothetical protein n=1 Tax=Symbioplanes lichenis TaxID=1629072 RepID=UPI00273A0690|nr:hypothetical protein [Actinoplanes lichenis]
MVAKVGRELVKFIADELGITDAIDCFTQGDIEGCVNTALNIVASVVGGAAGKLIARYAFRANKLVAAIKRGKSLAGQLFNALGEYKKSRKAVEEATSCIFHSFVAGTLVLMADGSFKPIDEIDVGD